MCASRRTKRLHALAFDLVNANDSDIGLSGFHPVLNVPQLLQQVILVRLLPSSISETSHAASFRCWKPGTTAY